MWPVSANVFLLGRGGGGGSGSGDLEVMTCDP